MLPAPGAANTALFFCRLSSRLFLRSSTMLVSLLRLASSVSMPFLKPFLLRSAFMVPHSWVTNSCKSQPEWKWNPGDQPVKLAGELDYWNGVVDT